MSESNHTLLSLIDIGLSRQNRSILHSISLDIRVGEILVLIGSNGVGKSSLLEIIANMIRPTSGIAEWKSISQTNTRFVYMPQNYRLTILNTLNVHSNLHLNEIILGENGGAVSTPRRILKKMLWFLGPSASAGPESEPDELFSMLCPFVDPATSPDRLSGGEQQILCLLRTLAVPAMLYLLDEPTAALGLEARFAMWKEICRVHRKQNSTFVLVTHSIDEALLLGNRICHLGGAPAAVNTEVQLTAPLPRSIEYLQTPEATVARHRLLSLWESDRGDKTNKE